MTFIRFQNDTSFYIIQFSVLIAAAEKTLIRSGLRDIEGAAPCIQFVEYEDGDSRLPNTYVQVIKGQG